MAKAPVVLMILDGWGVREGGCDNAINLAHPANFLKLQKTYPYTQLECSGQAVGLPRGQMGNSEVGHLNLGAGRIVFQEITRISNAIDDGSFFVKEELLRALDFAKKNGGQVHLMGLLSDGGVHSELSHLFALLDLCKMQEIEKVFVHAFLDGRDVGPKSALTYINALENKMKDVGLGQIATLGGRYYGMDRDNRWERIARAYNAMVLGIGPKAANAQAALESSYEARVTDEFVEPVVIVDELGDPLGQVENGDSLIFFNFRADRARQISHAFLDPALDKFERLFLPHIHFLCMTQYDEHLQAPVVFLPQNLQNTLGEVLAGEGLKQLRIAETEKYAHVTFFFNGGVEEPNPGEERILIPSPTVATYNLKPEMSAEKVTEQVLAEIDRDYFDVVIMNYANPDMVGHTGVLKAAVQAVQTLDKYIIKVVDRVLDKGGVVLITADHGNCELMVCPETGSPFTAHTTNLVPLVLVSERHKGLNLRSGGSLRDVAPTMLSLLGINKPREMSGESLIVSDKL